MAADRPLSDRETRLLVSTLELLRTGEWFGGGTWVDLDTGRQVPRGEPRDPVPYLEQIAHLRVVQLCPCEEPKCEAVRFEPAPTANQRAVAFTCVDGKNIIVHVEEATRRLVELEII